MHTYNLEMLANIVNDYIIFPVDLVNLTLLSVSFKKNDIIVYVKFYISLLSKMKELLS